MDNGAWAGVLVVLIFSWISLFVALYYIRKTSEKFASFDGSYSDFSSGFWLTKPLCMNISILRCYRVLSMIFLFVVMGYIINDMGSFAFTRYTFWGLLLSIAYFMWVGVMTSDGLTGSDKRSSNFLLTALSIELVICLLYWGLFSAHYDDKTDSEKFHVVGAHIVVQCLLLVDMLASWYPLTENKGNRPMLIIFFATLFSTLYGTCIYAYSYSSETPMPYNILDPDHDSAAAAYILCSLVLQAALAMVLDFIYHIRRNYSLREAFTASNIGGGTNKTEDGNTILAGKLRF